MTIQQQLDQSLMQLVRTGDWPNVLATCEDNELQFSRDPNFRLPPLFYAVMLLGYMILNDLNNARFLWKRMPKEHRKSNELKAIWAITQQMWKRDTNGVYAALAGHEWDPLICPIVNTFSDSFRQRMFVLVSRGYEVITLSDFAQLLGIPESAAKSAGDNAGWPFDASTNSFQPRPLTQPAQPADAASSQQVTGLSRLGKLAENTVFLELSSN